MKSDIKNTVNLERLKQLIDSKKNRQEIADAISCDVSLVTHHYNGKRSVTMDFLKKYAQYFGVSSDYLLGLSDVPTTDKDLQFVCNYTGLNEDTIRWFRHSGKYITAFIEYLIRENLSLKSDQFTIKFDDNSYYKIEIHELYDAIKQLRNIEEYKSKLKEIGKRLSKVDPNSNESIDLSYEIHELEDKKELAEMMLNGSKYTISQDFNNLLSDFIKTKAEELKQTQ